MKNKEPLLVSEDRKTGVPIGYYLVTPEELPRLYRGYRYWLPMDTNFKDPETLDAATRRNREVLPKDFCWMDTGVGDPCKVKIRPENKRSQLWACGRHMARFQQEQATQRHSAEMRRQREEREKLNDFKVTQYEDAYDRLVELGWAPYLEKRPEKVKWSGTIRHTSVTFDLLTFAAMADPDVKEEEDDDIDPEHFAEVDEDFFKADL